MSCLKYISTSSDHQHISIITSSTPLLGGTAEWHLITWHCYWSNISRNRYSYGNWRWSIIGTQHYDGKWWSDGAWWWYTYCTYQNRTSTLCTKATTTRSLDLLLIGPWNVYITFHGTLIPVVVTSFLILDKTRLTWLHYIICNSL